MNKDRQHQLQQLLTAERLSAQGATFTGITYDDEGIPDTIGTTEALDLSELHQAADSELRELTHNLLDSAAEKLGWAYLSRFIHRLNESTNTEGGNTDE